MKKQLLAGLGILLAFAVLYVSFDYKTKQAEAQLKNQFVPNLIPITDNLYELGTSTKAFLKVYANEYCLQGDCITSWATGGGGGAGGGWSTSTPNIISTNWLSATNALVGINTSTPRAILAVKGISGTTTPVLLVTSSTNATLLRVDGNGTTTIPSLGTGPVYSSTGALYTNGTTGTGLTVQATSPTLVTPILGVASGTALTLSNNLWVTGTLRVTGTSTLATTSIPALSNLTSNGFVKTSGGTGLLSVDTATYLTGNQTITLSGDVSGSGETSITTAIGNDKVTEAMLKVVDTPTDEDILTYESTTGDFEWHTPAQLSLPTYTYASSSYVNLWNLTAGTNIVITTSSVPTIAVSSTPSFTTLTTTGNASIGGALSVTATTTLTAATTTINGLTYYWPASVSGTKILQNDGTGQLSWVADQTGGGGSLSGGTVGFAAIWASSTSVTIGTLLDNGTVAGVNATSSTVSFNIQGSGALNPFNVSSSTGNSILHIGVNSFVGVNTSTPTFPITLVGTGNTQNIFTVATSTNQRLFVVNEGFNSGGNTIGYVGVNTTTPYMPFLVVRPSAAGDSAQQNIVGFSYNGVSTGAMGTNAAGVRIGSVSSSNFGLFTGNSSTNGLVLTTAGLVGIASNTPIATLSVTGIAGATSPLVIASSTNTPLLTVGHNGSTTLSSLGTGCVGVSSGNLYTTSCGGSASASGTPGAIQFAGAGSTLNANDLFFFDNTNLRLGINSTTPIATLSVVGKSGSTADILNVASSSGTSIFRVIASTTAPTLIINKGNATTTVQIDSTSATKGSCLKLKDADGSGFTYVVVNNGTLTASTASCE